MLSEINVSAEEGNPANHALHIVLSDLHHYVFTDRQMRTFEGVHEVAKTIADYINVLPAYPYESKPWALIPKNLVASASLEEMLRFDGVEDG